LFNSPKLKHFSKRGSCGTTTGAGDDTDGIFDDDSYSDADGYGSSPSGTDEFQFGSMLDEFYDERKFKKKDTSPKVK
jgi:hypothetical protein